MDLRNELLGFMLEFQVPETVPEQTKTIKKTVEMFDFAGASREAESLEDELESQINILKELCSGDDSNSSNDNEGDLPDDEDVDSCATRIEELIDELNEVNSRMENTIEPARLSNVQRETLQRHRDVLDEHEIEFNNLYEDYKRRRQGRD